MQKVDYDCQKGVSQPDVDSEDTEAEWKLFRRLIFKHYKGSSIYQGTELILYVSTLFCYCLKVEEVVNLEEFPFFVTLIDRKLKKTYSYTNEVAQGDRYTYALWVCNTG